MNRIDFNYDMHVETINRGKQVYQYQSPGTPQGNYYALHSSVTPSELGIGKMGENRAKGTVEFKLKKQYVVNEKTKALRSTSKAIDDAWSVRGMSQ
ncbi:polymorphic toxin type 46 domain-containing protein [Aeromonas hydrophila]|uniref:polymorphic toxin type 46 domain-containing protein n=1 Tax=Aeromonas hydrophila TaxID=644 RepID=UPI003BA34073